MNTCYVLLIINLIWECGGILINNHGHSSSYTKSCKQQCDVRSRESSTCSLPLPRHYTALYLQGQTITVDGRLDEKAWQEVPYTENFVDIRGAQYGAPPVRTQVKMRWDDTAVYVGAYLQEQHVWATYTQKDSRVYQENAFEVFFDVDSSMSMYKEIEINALGTTWDLIMSRAYLDGGDWKDWEGISKKGTFTDGAVNNASIPATFWSVEIAFPFSKLSENTTRSPGPATEGEMWFMELARPRYDLETLPNGTYGKKAGSSASWYAWSPTGAVNLHIPSRWGLLFFSKLSTNTVPTLQSERWTTYKALFDVFDALLTFKAVRGTYVDDLSELTLAPYITDGCFISVTITLTDDGFDVTAVSKKEPNVKGHINQNRHLSFE